MLPDQTLLCDGGFTNTIKKGNIVTSSRRPLSDFKKVHKCTLYFRSFSIQTDMLFHKLHGHSKALVAKHDEKDKKEEAKRAMTFFRPASMKLH